MVLSSRRFIMIRTRSAPISLHGEALVEHVENLLAANAQD
jgi:hypothetical protein